MEVKSAGTEYENNAAKNQPAHQLEMRDKKWQRAFTLSINRDRIQQCRYIEVTIPDYQKSNVQDKFDADYAVQLLNTTDFE